MESIFQTLFFNFMKQYKFGWASPNVQASLPEDEWLENYESQFDFGDSNQMNEFYNRTKDRMLELNWKWSQIELQSEAISENEKPKFAIEALSKQLEKLISSSIFYGEILPEIIELVLTVEKNARQSERNAIYNSWLANQGSVNVEKANEILSGNYQSIR